MRPYILTELHDWQAIKQAQALEHAGTPEGAAYLAESKRYGAAHDAILELRHENGNLLRGEYICHRCGLRKDSDAPKADF